jgi:hypothetical protein
LAFARQAKHQAAATRVADIQERIDEISDSVELTGEQTEVL